MHTLVSPSNVYNLQLSGVVVSASVVVVAERECKHANVGTGAVKFTIRQARAYYSMTSLRRQLGNDVA